MTAAAAETVSEGSPGNPAAPPGVRRSSGTLHYILRRLGQAVVVLWGAVTLSFLIIHLVPGDPVRIMTGGGEGGEGAALDSAAEAQLREQLGLDQPILIQYFDFLWRAATFDFGMSYSTGQPVSSAIATALPVTIELGIASIIASVLLALLFALGSVLLPTQTLRSGFQSASLLGTAMPSFWVGILLLQLFSFQLGWFPAFGSASWQALVLPSLTLALLTAGTLGQILTRGLNEALAESYADTARAKGISELRVVLRHALRNASLPAFTMVGMMVGGILSGTTIVETIYGRQGIGMYFVQAIQAQDFPLIQALVILSGAFFVIVTLIVDLAYRWIDPRVVAPQEHSSTKKRSTAKTTATKAAEKGGTR
ncbi:ABC transporter permease [Nesterenkonia alkaliphila]|uniref:ABC transporter permease subunit n=1 Tax=Nesterenkonia alkaliphila TaxID=1463631 RepID=A0A7K1UL74_9MICC|nr:ABC transporter permease [Nesterenkonia alkaliphila]MVT27223.1 ABC transporter permease subunit [Nesterenkonia alkaliphila]GFZ78481.1 peptide ABC transporter permease [Nesterenkonia alkaliphila]